MRVSKNKMYFGNACFIDHKKAFDKIDHSFLLRSYTAKDFSEKVTKFLKVFSVIEIKVLSMAMKFHMLN